jgi:hypothetical protein
VAYFEPGNDPPAPYHREHVTTTIIEAILAQALGVNLEEYAAGCDKMTYTGSKFQGVPHSTWIKRWALIAP